MGETLKRLPDSEIEIMLIIWHAEQPVTAKYIHNQLQGLRKWAFQTLVTVLERLVAKEFIRVDKSGRNNLYYALISEEEYRCREGKHLLEKLYGSSLKNLVASLYDGKEINHEDLQELRDYLDKSCKEGKKC